MSFSEGEGFSIFDDRDPDWWLAEIDGKFGLVPSNFLEKQVAEEMPALVQNESLDPKQALFATLAVNNSNQSKSTLKNTRILSKNMLKNNKFLLKNFQ